MILLTGASGRLGTEIQKLGIYLTPDLDEFDLTVPENVFAYLEKHKPSLIIHAAGYVDSLKPEVDALEAVKCYELNVTAVKCLIKYAKCPIIYISTEGVIEPYNMYTLTKLMAEYVIKQHPRYTIVRTNFWLRPFPFPKAAGDLLTIGDYIDVIAEKINQLVELPCENDVIYIGTGIKTVFDLAVQTVPDIESVPSETFGIPLRKGLLNI